jgi:hypothetical protein
MKKLLLIIAVTGATMWSQAQVIFAVQSPASIEGNYAFSWADPAGGWGTPNFNIPGTYVEGELMIVDDGSAGLNPQGNPVSAEGCNTLINDLTGKIAFIYRNTCEFGTKAFNAQVAGAIGVVIVNREPEVIAMGAGAQGAGVTIPVAFVSSITGALMLAEMANGPVDVFFGNKTGLFADDAGVTTAASLISKSYGTPVQLSQNATEFNFEVGTRVYNYGTNNQTNVSVTATVNGPAGIVYNQTVNAVSIPSGDSVDIFPGGSFSFPAFSLATYPVGRYTLTYTVDLGVDDEYNGDNSVSSDFVINAEVFSLAQIDSETGLVKSNNAYRPSNNTATFSACVPFRNANASRIGAAGLYFSAQGTAVDLTGEEMILNLYRWDDSFTDLNDANLAFSNLTPVAFGFYDYPSDLQGETVYGSFTTQVILEDNARYLACVQTYNLDLFIGFDTETNYIWNEAYHLQPLTIIENDGQYFASGFGADVVPAVGIRIFNAAELGVEETAAIDGVVYPNPASDLVTVSITADGAASLSITDLSGRTVASSSVSFVNGRTELNMADLTSGAYIINVTMTDGRTAKFNVVKN